MADITIDHRHAGTSGRQLTSHPSPTRSERVLAAIGDWLSHHQKSIQSVQWIVVGIYLFLVAVPAFWPLPPRGAHIWTNLILFAQFVFWGIWWPFVLLSMILVGRLWCGVLCPEGALSETMSRHGRGRSTPRWVSWKGWPFVAFACTTAYGQFVSVYQYPKPTLLILGGSTLAAMAIGFLYGREKRVWCRYLCPVNGVFGLLAKLSPLHYRVDREAWEHSPKPVGVRGAHVNCAPLVPIRTMRGASQCHMCGRCSGFRGAVALAPRSPSHEIVHVAGTQARPWETWLITFGLMGLATAAFHWTSSASFVFVKQRLAEWLVANTLSWWLTAEAPWWLLTSYPDQNDVMTPLDGVVLAAYLVIVALAIGGALLLCLAASALILKSATGAFRIPFHHLAQALIPLAGCNVFLGLFGLTTTMLHAEGMNIPFLKEARLLLMIAAAVWSLALSWRILGCYTDAIMRRVGAMTPVAAAAAIGVAGWAIVI